jgi:hypothetical protein
VRETFSRSDAYRGADQRSRQAAMAVIDGVFQAPARLVTQVPDCLLDRYIGSGRKHAYRCRAAQRESERLGGARCSAQNEYCIGGR